MAFILKCDYIEYSIPVYNTLTMTMNINLRIIKPQYSQPAVHILFYLMQKLSRLFDILENENMKKKKTPSKNSTKRILYHFKLSPFAVKTSDIHPNCACVNLITLLCLVFIIPLTLQGLLEEKSFTFCRLETESLSFVIKTHQENASRNP